MPDFAGMWESLKEFLGGVFAKIGELMEVTHLPEQVKDVDFSALFTNPWFLVPFIGFVGWRLYKQAFKDLVIFAILMGVWYASGTDYMQTLVVGDELQVNKVLPVLFGGAVGLGVIIYLLFGRSD